MLFVAASEDVSQYHSPFGVAKDGCVLTPHSYCLLTPDFWASSELKIYKLICLGCGYIINSTASSFVNMWKTISLLRDYYANSFLETILSRVEMKQHHLMMFHYCNSGDFYTKMWLDPTNGLCILGVVICLVFLSLAPDSNSHTLCLSLSLKHSFF